MQPLKFQASISGFGMKPATVLGIYHPAKGTMLVHSAVEYEAERREGCLFITNSVRIGGDAVFSQEFLGAAIDAYEAVLNAGIEFNAAARQADPGGSIVTDGYDETGPKRRISDGISNAKVATLAACWAMQKQQATNDALDMMDALLKLQQGMLVTI